MARISDLSNRPYHSDSWGGYKADTNDQTYYSKNDESDAVEEQAVEEKKSKPKAIVMGGKSSITIVKGKKRDFKTITMVDKTIAISTKPNSKLKDELLAMMRNWYGASELQNDNVEQEMDDNANHIMYRMSSGDELNGFEVDAGYAYYRIVEKSKIKEQLYAYLSDQDDEYLGSYREDHLVNAFENEYSKAMVRRLYNLGDHETIGLAVREHDGTLQRLVDNLWSKYGMQWATEVLSNNETEGKAIIGGIEYRWFENE